MLASVYIIGWIFLYIKDISLGPSPFGHVSGNLCEYIHTVDVFVQIVDIWKYLIKF